MKRFLAVYTGSAAASERAGWSSKSPEEVRELQARGISAWSEWMTTHAQRIVDSGGPLGTTKRVAAEGIEDVTNALTGYVIVQAESHAAAARLFEQHPHFRIFPGDSVEVMEILPVPGR
ncbi:MAG: hypothetical protein R3E86_03575 [Pseudomonadales bacterium]